MNYHYDDDDHHHHLLPRDAMRNRGLRCRPVSVRLSVTFVHSIQTAEDIVKLLFRPDHSGSFSLRAPVPNSKENPLTGAQNTRGWEKLRFLTEIAVYR